MLRCFWRGWPVFGLMILLGPSAAHADQIRLSTGEVLTVEILETTEQTIRFRHQVLGELTLPRAAVEVVAPKDVAREDGLGASEPDAPAKPQAAAKMTDEADGAETPPKLREPEPIPPSRDWKFKLTLAAASASGNSESTNLVTKFTAARETPRLRTLLDAGYFFTSSSATRTENRFTAGGRNEWLNPESKVFYFADARYDFDEFQSWEHRVGAHAGLGYKVIEPPPLRLDLLAGVGAIKEFGSNNEDVRPEGTFGVNGEWDIAVNQKLKFDSTIFPDLGDLGEFRWVNNAAWSLLIDHTDRLSVTAGVGHEHQSKVDPGRQHDDLRLFAGIDWEF